MYRTDIQVGECVNEGFELFKRDAGFLVLCGLVATLIGSLSGGILAGPMAAGLLMVCLSLHDQQSPKPQLAGLFRGFDHFLQTFLFWLVWAIIIGGGMFLVSLVAGLLTVIPVIGVILAPLINLLLMAAGTVFIPAFLMFSFYFITEEGMDFWPASMKSIELVRDNPKPYIILMLVVTLIGAVGALLCCIGSIVTVPIQASIVTVTYRKLFPAEPAFASGFSSPPPPPPPFMDDPTDFT